MYKENYKDKGLLKTGSSGGEGVFSEKIGGFLENQGFSGKREGVCLKIEVLVEKWEFLEI